jgi:GNAT superfamily N-acetyltransferase
MNTRYVQADSGFEQWGQLLRLLMESFAYMAERIDPPSSLLRMGLEDLAEKARSEKLVLAMDGERIVGCVYLREDTDAIYIGKLAVAHGYRGFGISRQLIAIAERQAQETGRGWLELQTRIELWENHQAFARLGFVKTGETSHEGYNRPTSITMRKRVELLKAAV